MACGHTGDWSWCQQCMQQQEAEAERLLEELEERKEVDGRVFAALQEVAEILDEPHPTDAPAAVRSLVAERDSLNALAAKRAVELEDANAKAGGE